LPEQYPPYQTCHRRFQQWVRSGIFRAVLEALAEDLRSRGGFDLEETFIDGSFAPAKKGVLLFRHLCARNRVVSTLQLLTLLAIERRFRRLMLYPPDLHARKYPVIRWYTGIV
jgi:transposase